MRRLKTRTIDKLALYKTPFLYTGSSVLKAIVSILVSFIIAKYISPEDLGIWSSLTLLLVYSNFLQGGVINGLNLELPYLYGRGEIEKGNNLVSITNIYIIIIGIISFVCGIIFFLYYPFPNIKLKWGVLAISFIIPITFYQNYLLSTFRSNNSFIKLSYIQIIESIINTVTLIFIIYFSYFGMLLKAIIVILIYTILLHFYRPIKVNSFWDNKDFFGLLKVGLPIFSLAYIESLTSTIDKVWILKYSDLTNLGLYSFALYALTMITLFSSSIASYIYPKMTYNYGKYKDSLLLWKMVKKITLIVFIILFPIVIIGYFILPYVIERYFPAYILSTNTMRLLLIAGLFKGSVIGINVLWSMKKWKYIILYQGIYSLLLISITLLCFHIYDKTIEGVGLGVLFANIINFFNGMYFSYKGTHEESNYKEKVITN